MSSSASFRCGAAARSFRPADGLRLSGYGRPHSRRGQSDGGEPLSARAIYFEGGSGEGRPNKLLIVVLDIMSGSGPILRGVAARLAERATGVEALRGLDASNILIVGTHTHAAPGRHFGVTLYDWTAQGGWLRHDRAWVEQLVGEATEAATEAARSAVPARLGSAIGKVWGAPAANGDGALVALGHNRSFEAHRENDVHTLEHWRLGPGDGAPGTHESTQRAVDPRLRVVAAFRDDEPDALIATFATFACHNGCLGPDNASYHREWIGRAVTHVEDALGGGLVAAMGASAGGDYSAMDQGHRVTVEQGRANLERIGGAVGARWRELLESARRAAVANPTVRCQHGVFDPVAAGLPPFVIGESVTRGADEVRDPGDSEIATSSRYERAKAPKDEQAPKKPAFGIVQDLLRLIVKPSKSHPISLAQLGDTVLFAMPFESTTVAGWQIERALAEAWARALPDEYVPRFSPLHHVNDYAGYVTTPEEYAVQQYEGGHTLYGRRMLERLTDAFVRLVPGPAAAGGKTREQEVLQRLRDADPPLPWIGEAVERAKQAESAIRARAGERTAEVLGGSEEVMRRVAEDHEEDTATVFDDLKRRRAELVGAIKEVTRAIPDPTVDLAAERERLLAELAASNLPQRFRNLIAASRPRRRRRCSPEELSEWLVDDLVAGRPVKVAGGAWSFSNVAYPRENGCLALPAESGGGVYAVRDREVRDGAPREMVWVEAGATFTQVNEFLRHRGRAVANQPGFNDLSYIGVMATGGHGSGLAIGPICDQVRALDLLIVDAAGKVQKVRVERAGEGAVSKPGELPEGVGLIADDDVFRAAVVGMGLQGVILRVMVETRAAYRILEARRMTTWERLVAGELTPLLERQRATAGDDRLHSVEIWINPYDIAFGSHTAVVGTRAETTVPPGGERAPALEHGGGKQGQAASSFFARRLPGAMPLVLETALNAVMPKGDVVMESPEGLSFAGCNGIAVLSCGFSVHVDHTIEAVGTVLEWADRKYREPDSRHVTSPIGVRFVKQSDAWLTPQYGRDTVMIEIPLLAETENREEILGDILELAADKHGGRPHWGQYNPLKKETLRALYPEECWKKFEAARKRLDPKGVCDGPFSEQLGF